VLSESIKQLLEDAIRDKWGASIQKAVRELNQLPELRNAGIYVSQTTSRRYVRGTDWGKIAYKATKTFMLSQKNIRDRLAFCQKMEAEGYCRQDPSGIILRENILFTDESVVELFPNPNSQNVRIRTQNHSLRSPLQIPKHGLKVHVAGGMTANGLTPLLVIPHRQTINAQYYQSAILPHYARELYRDNGDPGKIFTAPSLSTFMQDGAPAHSANTSLAIVRSTFPNAWCKSIWPGGSPDLNPVEHLWTILQESVFTPPRPTNREGLISRLQETWTLIPTDLLKRLIHSFPNRIQQCLDRGGRQTLY
jgi:hypothetical protein